MLFKRDGPTSNSQLWRAAWLASGRRQPDSEPNAQVRMWASAERGANITFVLPPQSVCGSIVTLTYLTSNTTGAFRLTCSPGCHCSPIRKYWQHLTDPFPVVTGQKNCKPGGRNCDSLKVTYDTAFNVLREKDSECRMTATTLTNQRVRIDGLYVETPSEKGAEYIKNAPQSNANQRHFGQHALSRQCSDLRRRPE